MAKNERQHQQNLARAQGEQGATSSSGSGRELQSHRKKDIDRTLAVTRTSTASLGRFDKSLEGEKKLKGVKRKVCTFCFSSHRGVLRLVLSQFDPTEVSSTSEKSNNLAILSKLDREPQTKKAKRYTEPSAGTSEVLNVRKAVRHETKGVGAVAFRKDVGGKGKGFKREAGGKGKGFKKGKR